MIISNQIKLVFIALLRSTVIGQSAAHITNHNNTKTREYNDKQKIKTAKDTTTNKTNKIQQ